MKLDHLSDQHLVCAQLDNGIIDLYLVSGYFQFSEPIEGFIRKTKKILCSLKGKSIMLCLDTNSKSPMWHSDTLDNEGEKVEELIQEMNMVVINEPGNPSTFATTRGESNIDITLASNNAVRGIKDWIVQDSWITSDHRVISFQYSNQVTQGKTTEKQFTSKFATDKADWQKFEKSLDKKVKTIMDGEIWSAKPDKTMLIYKVKQIRRILYEASREAIPIKQANTKYNVKWWTTELTSLKKGVYKTRKEFQKAKKKTMNQ